MLDVELFKYKEVKQTQVVSKRSKRSINLSESQKTLNAEIGNSTHKVFIKKSLQFLVGFLSGPADIQIVVQFQLCPL